MKSAQWMLALAASLSLASAQSGSTSTPAPSSTGSVSRGTTTASSSRSSATGSEPPKTITVTAGIQHAFRPAEIIANPGDTIRFEFQPTNHSVVKAEFGDPCIPYEYHQRDKPTFFSGNKESQVDDPRPVWNLRVNDTNPTFFYCSAPESCTKWKMVGVINPSGIYTLENQLKYHENSTKFQLSPGEPYPAESSPQPTTTPDNSGGGGLGGGAIAGIAIGAAAVLIIGVALVWFCGRRGGIEKGYRKSAVVQPAATSQMVEPQFGGSDKGPGSHYASGVPSQHDPYRAASPSSWSNSQPLSSPHQSYLGHNGSPGFPPYNTHSPLMAGQEHQHTGSTFYDVYGNEITKAPEQPPVELPGQETQHPSELAAHPYTGSSVHTPVQQAAQSGAQPQFVDQTTQYQAQQAYVDQPQSQYTDHIQQPNQPQR